MDTPQAALTENEIRTKFIIHSLTSNGWVVGMTMREEYYFKDGDAFLKHDFTTGAKHPQYPAFQPDWHPNEDHKALRQSCKV